MSDPCAASDIVELGGCSVHLYCLLRLAAQAGVELGSIPFSGRVLIETLLRSGDQEAARALARRLAAGEDAGMEMPFHPARVLVQDYTGIPLLVDLAALRDHLCMRGGAPERVNPAVPTELVVDHSLQVDVAGVAGARTRNEALEFARNEERYAFLKWAEKAFANLCVIPPGRGIVHQVNLERLTSVVVLRTAAGATVAFPDTVLGTDSHTTMVNGLGVLGWGIGGLEAEAVMLGLAHPMAIPRIVGVRLAGRPQPGVTATDIVLSLTEHLRAHNLVGALVEFTGPGVAYLSAPDRCTIANMAPEYGAVAAFFPVDAQTLEYLRQTGRDEAQINLVENYCRRQQLWNSPESPAPRFRSKIDFDLASVETSLAGPSQPHQRVSLGGLAASFRELHPVLREAEQRYGLKNGDIVIAAITSCTNTSNPKAMLAAGLLARCAVECGLAVPAHVKTSLAPGSSAVTRVLEAAGLLPALETLGFHVVGYGCATCNGGSGPLSPEVAAAIEGRDLAVCAVLSGNRNFEGRIHPLVRASYLASPPMVVALALAGHVRGDLASEPLGLGADGRLVFLADLWPDDIEVAELAARHVIPQVFHEDDLVAPGWQAIVAGDGPVYPWEEDSTYVRRPPYLENRRERRGCLSDGMIRGARALVLLGDHVSTDHISPVGAIEPGSPAGIFLRERGIATAELNSYGARRGNHEVMARGTFANPRLRNQMLPGVEGGYTLHVPSGDRLPIYDAATRYGGEETPLLVLAGKSYGMGSSRDWAAKGPWLLGVHAVIAESFERIHRANLCAVGILPLAFPAGQGWASLGLDGCEEYVLESMDSLRDTGHLRVRAERAGEIVSDFMARVQIDSSGEWDVLLEGGMLPYLLRNIGT